MKKVLIIGIDSFTGKHLSSYLKSRDYDVYGTSLFSKANRVYTCDITKKGDIQNILKIIKPDYLIHLSGISYTAHENYEDFYRVNTIGAINILDAFIELKLKPEKIVLASSATVYGNQGYEVLDESLCPKPANHYGASKYAMESLAKNYFAKLPIIITRPFNYTGIGQTENFLIPKIVSHFQKRKKTIELGNLHVSREFNDIAFVCEIYAKLLLCTADGETVNIASNRGIKLLDIIAMMNTIADYEIAVTVNPAYIRKDEIKKLTGSNKKLFNLIGTVEQKTLQETLKEMFEAYSNN